MERIKEAIERAKSQRDGLYNGAARVATSAPAPAYAPYAASDLAATLARPVERLDHHHLEAYRVVAHQSANPYTAPFDVLRTKILQEMDEHGWQVLVVTSPTAACGKTVTSVNLALSMSRQTDRSVLLVDFDMRKPQIATILGLRSVPSIEAVVNGRSPLADAIIPVEIEGQRISVFASKAPVVGSSDLLASRQMKDLMQALRRLPGRPIIIVDMPPLFVSDDVLAFLPMSDCTILVVAERSSKVADVQSSEQILSDSNLIGLVLTKSQDRFESYY